MADPIAGASRQPIDVAETEELLRRAGGTAGAQAITVADMERLLDSGALVLDGARRRPRYFDGRFLTAADLQRDQAYVRQRQADLARAAGFGVVQGLQVSLRDDRTGRTVEIAPGHGVTPAGDTVAIGGTRRIDLADVAAIQRLDASFGLAAIPAMPPGRRTGVFVLALRPVEFSANPIAAYPTTLAGDRSVQDGDIVEATAVTLIPWPGDGASASPDERRAAVAREIFVEGSTRGVPREALPLAMVALDRGVVRWLDMDMVRRELGYEPALQASLGARPRALREAHLLQHRAHLAELLAERTARNAGWRFPADRHFAALPPAAQMPAAALDLDADAFRQVWFPPAIDVELSFVASDEVAALVEESLALAPIDLRAGESALGGTAVLVVVPVTRQRLQQLAQQLGSLRRPLAAAAPNLVHKRLPLDALRLLGRPRATLPSTAAPDPADAAWRDAVRTEAANDRNGGLLWYVRRRHLAWREDLAGAAVQFTGDDARVDAALDARLRDLRLTTRFNRLSNAATSAATPQAVALLASPRLAASDVLFTAALVELEAAVAPVGEEEPRPQLAQAATARVAERFGDPRMGEGIARLTAAEPELASDARLVARVAASGTVPELDAAVRAMPDDAVPAFAARVAELARADDAAGIAALLR